MAGRAYSIFRNLNIGERVDEMQTSYTVEADLLGALAHPTRLQILDLLRDGETCVCHIQAVLRQRQAYVSQHLMALRQAGLVTCRKEGLRVFYQLSDPRVFDVLDSARQMAYAHSKRRERPSNAALLPPAGRCNCPRCASASA